MSSWTATSAVAGVDFRLSVGEALQCWQVCGELRRMLTAAAVDKLVGEALRKSGMVISPAELQAGADQFRVARGLHTAEQTNRWLRVLGWTTDDFEAAVVRGLRVEKLLRSVPRAAIEAAFERRRGEYDRVHLRHIVVSSEGAAHELLARLREEDAQFAELAREFSLDANSRGAGGDLGFVERHTLSSSVAASVFAAAPGGYVGPLLTAQGVAIYLVGEIAAARLDANVEQLLRLRLCRQWLANELKARRLTFPLLDMLPGRSP